MAVYGYVRVSTARQANEGESLEVQRRQIEGYAHMHGLMLARSGRGRRQRFRSGRRAAAAGPLFAKLTKGDIVVAPKLDRLFRSALDALKVVEDLKKRGVALHLLDLGGDISGNGLSKLFLTIAAAFAEAERDRIRERIGQVKADLRVLPASATCGRGPTDSDLRCARAASSCRYRWCGRPSHTRPETSTATTNRTRSHGR